MKDTDLEERLLQPVDGGPENAVVCAKKLVGDTDGWPVAQVIEWLQTDGRFAPTVPFLIEALAKKLNEVGAPVWRMMIGYRTLHPRIAVEGAVWTRGQKAVVRRQADHGIWTQDSYVGSPVEQVYEQKVPIRWRLDSLTEKDHQVLHDVRNAGGTDYFGQYFSFAKSRGGSLMLATDCKDGFSESDIVKFEALAKFLTPVLEVIVLNSVAVNLLNTYLGPRTGQRVMNGSIQRGDGEVIDAALWFSDLRNFTHMTEHLPPEELIDILNTYFEHVYQAVTTYGGEVLRFIGDAMLIVFPAENESKRRSACKAALDAAMDAFNSLAVLNNMRRRAGKPEIHFGVGLHVGHVVYGNVGAPDRLDFTVMGSAVNRTARLESLTKQVGVPLLISKEFQTLTGAPSTYRGEYEVKGIDAKMPVYSYRGFDTSYGLTPPESG